MVGVRTGSGDEAVTCKDENGIVYRETGLLAGDGGWGGVHMFYF